MTADVAEMNTRSKDPSFAVDSILLGVKAAAEAGKRDFKTRDYGFGDGSCYATQET